MKKSEAKTLYIHMTTLWPMALKPNASESFQKAFIEKLYALYKDFTFEEVYTAVMDLAMEGDMLPSDHAIKNQIYWGRRQARNKAAEPVYAMEVHRSDGTEAAYGVFTREDFKKHPANVNRLEPEEWQRRFMATRNRWIAERWRDA